MFRVISLNANGIRAAARKGFFEWMAAQDADVVCIQETKAQVHQLTDAVFSPGVITAYYEDAEKKGYSGTAIYTRSTNRRRSYAVTATPSSTTRAATSKCSSAASASCRCTCRPARQAKSASSPSTAAWTLSPSTCTEAETAQAIRVRHLRRLEHRAQGRSTSGTGSRTRRTRAACPKSAPGSTRCSANTGWVDAFRTLEQEPEQYTWWSNRGAAWDNNVGWRIDYHVVTPGLATRCSARRSTRRSDFPTMRR